MQRKQLPHENDIVDLVLRIPSKDVPKMDWIKSQSPSTISELLLMVEVLYKSMEHGDKANDMKEYYDVLSKKHEAEMDEERAKYKKKLDEYKVATDKIAQEERTEMEKCFEVKMTQMKESNSDLRRQITEFESQKEGEMQQLKEKMHTSLTQEHEEKMNMEKRRATRMEEENKRLVCDSIQQLKTLQDKLDEMSREKMQLQTTLQTHEQNIRTELTEKYTKETNYLQSQLLEVMKKQRDESEQHAKVVQMKDDAYKVLEAKAEAKLNETIARKDELYKNLEDRNDERYHQLMKDKDKLWQDSEERFKVMNEEFQRSVRKLTGNNHVVGKAGEKFFENTFNELNVEGSFGTLTNTTGRGRNDQGYMDHDWDCEVPNCYPIRASFDEKHSGNDSENEYITNHELSDFHYHVKRSAELDNRNIKILLGLTRAVQNKSRFCIEFHHGIPVVYASRSPNDNMSARELIEITLRVVKGIWPILCSKKAQDQSYENLSGIVVNFVNNQLKSMEDHGKYIKESEKLTSQALRNADSLVKNYTKLQETYEVMKRDLGTLSGTFYGSSQEYNNEQEQRRVFIDKYKAVIVEVYRKWLESKKEKGLKNTRYNATVAQLQKIQALDDEIVRGLNDDSTILDHIGKELAAENRASILQKRKYETCMDGTNENDGAGSTNAMDEQA